jgi:hypothetical protein
MPEQLDLVMTPLPCWFPPIDKTFTADLKVWLVISVEQKILEGKVRAVIIACRSFKQLIN